MKRMNVSELEPKSYEILLAMEKYLATTDLSHRLRELIKIRASQINKCAYCLEMHTKDARENGENRTENLCALCLGRKSSVYRSRKECAPFHRANYRNLKAGRK